MGFRPRHYMLIVVIFGLAIWNVFRFRRMHQSASTQAPAAARSVVHGTSPIWAFYDRAAELRDAPDGTFAPALASLTEHIDTANGLPIPPQTSPGELADLRGCRTWLLFYRQAHTGRGAQSDWLARSRSHVLSCVANHRDLAG